MIGNHVIYVDEVAVEHDALVTTMFGSSDSPSLNVVYVSKDENANDQYGRQLAARVASCVHESSQGAHGRFWREP